MHGELLDAGTAQALELAWFRAQLMPVTHYGRRAFDALRPFVPGEEQMATQTAQHIMSVANEFDDECVDALRDALSKTPDLTDILARISVGRSPDDADLLLLLRACDALVRIDGLAGTVLGRSGNAASDALAQAIEHGRSGHFGFYLDASFDEELRSARDAYERSQSAFELARSRIAERVAHELGRERIESDEFIVMRDTLVHGVPQSVHIVREASTYYLCELELDDQALVLLGKRDTAASTLAHAEERVRERIGTQIRDHIAGLDAALTHLGAVDLIVAQVRFARRYACTAPEYVPTAELSFSEGRFLPLVEELEREGRRYVRIDVQLDAVAVLTGPNMGGKSVCLRTCASIVWLSAYGLPVPARDVRAGLFASVAWLGLGAEAAHGSLLSAFASELLRLREILAMSHAHGIVFVDEFARTTNPSEGMALLVAMIADLRRRGCIGFIATHLAGVAAAAGALHFAVRGLRDAPKQTSSRELSVILAALGDAMDYRIVRADRVDESHADAIALAKLLGIDDEIIADAYKAFHAAH